MQDNRFKSTMAVLVAFVSVMGAVTAYLATVAASSAGDEDFTGHNASINAQKIENVNYINTYEHYRAFGEYSHYLELGNLMYDPSADEKTSIENGAIQREAWGIAGGLLNYGFFDPRYVSADDTYNLQRELDEAWENATLAHHNDIDPAPYYTESDRQRKRSSYFTGDMVVFAFSFWFLTLAHVTEKKIKYIWSVLGILLAVAGIAGVLIGGYGI